MPRRHILTERQRAALFELPTDEAALLRHYTLADDDLEHIRLRRRPENRIGFALQLCALRYPGRLLGPGEIIPDAVLRFIAAQLGLNADDLLRYAIREETRHEHLGALRKIYGYRMFSGRRARDLKVWLGSLKIERMTADEDFLIELVEQDPDITLAELRGALIEAEDVTVGVPAIFRMLKRLGFTYKKRRWSRMSDARSVFAAPVMNG